MLAAQMSLREQREQLLAMAADWDRLAEERELKLREQENDKSKE